MQQRFFGWVLMMFCLGVASNWAQFTPDEISKFPTWERFLREAEIVGGKQMKGDKAVTSPWVLELEKDGVAKKALWKNPLGRVHGYLESWKWEIAAYRISNYLDLNMVPPTIERRFEGDRGSLQFWVEKCRSLKDITKDKIKKPSYKILDWNRAIYLQRAFDSLIANEDRHQNQYLVSEDWRMILIDHSRSFRTGRRFAKRLMYGKNGIKQKALFKELPRMFIEKLESLTPEVLRDLMGPYLTEKEIEAVVARKKLILAEIDELVKANGADKVFY